jgi:hypothetical protein
MRFDMEPSRLLLSAALACALLGAGPAFANESVAAPAAVKADTDAQTRANFEQLRKMSVGHPSELFRIYAAEAAAGGNWTDAVRLFAIAASYADKYSQHRLSLLYWNGVGVQPDHALGYVWADLAAERGYQQFLAIREKMWAQLSADEQKRVAEIGQEYYNKYGDPTAKKRFATELGKAKRQTTGSHTGFVGNLAIISPGAGMDMFNSIGGVDLSQLYEKSRWDAQTYWKVEDIVWNKGNVTVGAMEAATPPAKKP